MLRRPVESDEDVQYTLASAEAGLLFFEQLEAKAKALGVLRGALSRWILPYDANTHCAQQQSRTRAVLADGAVPEFARDRLTEKEVQYLVRGANSVRRLIRVKIADDADIDQAREALATSAATSASSVAAARRRRDGFTPPPRRRGARR